MYSILCHQVFCQGVIALDFKKKKTKVGEVSNRITPQIFKNIRNLSGALHFINAPYKIRRSHFWSRMVRFDVDRAVLY